MAVFRVPFATTEELQPPFALDAASADGLKQILYNTDSLQVVTMRETISSEIGDVLAVTFHVVGVIDYICSAYPIVPSDPENVRVLRMGAASTGAEGELLSDCMDTAALPALGWLSSVGSVGIDVPIGATTCFASCEMEIPTIESVTVENFTVDNNPVSAMEPVCGDCGEEEKSVVKWCGCFVITTSN